jgi:hypothetical protein
MPNSSSGFLCLPKTDFSNCEEFFQFERLTGMFFRLSVEVRRTQQNLFACLLLIATGSGVLMIKTIGVEGLPIIKRALLRMLFRPDLH